MDIKQWNDNLLVAVHQNGPLFGPQPVELPSPLFLRFVRDTPTVLAEEVLGLLYNPTLQTYMNNNEHYPYKEILEYVQTGYATQITSGDFAQSASLATKIVYVKPHNLNDLFGEDVPNYVDVLRSIHAICQTPDMMLHTPSERVAGFIVAKMKNDSPAITSVVSSMTPDEKQFLKSVDLAQYKSDFIDASNGIFTTLGEL